MSKDAKGHGSDARGGTGQMVKDMRAHLIAHQTGVQKLARNMGRFVSNESGAGKNPLQHVHHDQQLDPEAHSGVIESVVNGLHDKHIDPVSTFANFAHFLHVLAGIAVADGTVHLIAYLAGWSLT